MEALDLRFVQALRCPSTGLALRQVSLESLARGGENLKSTHGWDSALLREDGAALYPVRAGVAVLLVDEMHPIERMAQREGWDDQQS